MTTQPILILPPRYTEDSIALWRASIRADWDSERLSAWRIPDDIAQEQRELVLYGEPLFAAAVGEQLGIALLEPSFDWLASVPKDYRLRDIEFMTFAQTGSLSDARFVKPAADKTFPPKVYANASELPQDIPPEAPVLVSEVVEWASEFRVFVLNNQPAAISPYGRHSQLAMADDGSWPFRDSERQEAIAFLGRLLADPRVSIPPAVVVDIGVIAGRGWAVVEANAAWGSGVYGCCPDDVLPVVRRACITGPVSEADLPWVMQRKEYPEHPSD
ncbi:MAG: ATP-grasp domain-containing protein [bacterium]|nr:ATP-grasp domain-containing protein [bacterium]